jgi:hypothetical protein
MLYNRCTGIYKFGNNTYPRRIRHRSNLGHIFRGKKCVLWAGKYGISLCIIRCYQIILYYLTIYYIITCSIFFPRLPRVRCIPPKSFSDMIYPEQFKMERSTGANFKADFRRFTPAYLALEVLGKHLETFAIECLTLTNTLCHPFDIGGSKQHSPCFVPYTRSFRIRWEDAEHIYKEKVPHVCAATRMCVQFRAVLLNVREDSVSVGSIIGIVMFL